MIESEMPLMSKEDIARLQLEDAIDLFFQDRYISSLTLVGAAEEVFKQLLRSENTPSSTDNLVAAAHRWRSILSHPAVIDSFLYSSIYKGRNEVKHHTLGKPEIVELDAWG